MKSEVFSTKTPLWQKGEKKVWRLIIPRSIKDYRHVFVLEVVPQLS